MKVTIDRKQWHRGDGNKDSALCVPETGKMCCLGFVCMEYGVKKLDMTGITCPAYLLTETELPNWLVEFYRRPDRGDADVITMMNINDTKGIDDVSRERVLTMLAASHGLELEFIG